MRISDWSSDVCSSDLLSSEDESRDTQGEGRRGEQHHQGGDDAVGPLHFALPSSVRMAARRSSRCCSTKIGRASCRERVCQYVEISVVAVSLTKTNRT